MQDFPEIPLWQSLKQHVDKDLDIIDVSCTDDSIIFTFDNPGFPGNISQTSARIRRHTTTLGIDVQGYSGKGLHEQFLTSVKIFAFIEKTIAWFDRNAQHASCRPDAIIPTGDGALLFFGEEVNSLIRAINFSLVMNIFFQATNNTVPLIGATYDGLKIPIRFTIAMGKAIMMKDPNGSNNVVGESIIRCSRIMSCDKGTHFLLDKNAADNLIQNSKSIKLGLQAASSQIFEQIQCSVSTRCKKSIKKMAYEFYNVSIKYELIHLIDKLQKKRKSANDNYLFELGTKTMNNIYMDKRNASKKEK